MSFARQAFLKTLEGLPHGSLELICSDRTYRFGKSDAEPRAQITVHREEFFKQAVFGGDDGIGDSYVDGDWSSPSVVDVIRLGIRNLDYLESTNALLSKINRLIFRLRHLKRANTIEGSKKNIQEHYDLSNDFFRLFLDQNMMYSSAIYVEPDDTLEVAQMEKVDRICRKLRLGPQDHILEIGTGWGTFAIHAAQNYGCRVTTTTISKEQHALAKQRFAGDPRITLVMEDYRKLTGSFDKIVSIEMFEAVGLEFYDAFFGACDRLLKPGGAMLMQAITMNERRFDTYRKGSDWIQRLIFPGSQLASMREVLASLARATKMEFFHAEDIGMHYAETLAEWRRRFHATFEEARKLGFDDRFGRLWDYYLAFCEGAFRERHIGDMQLIFAKAGAAPGLYGEPWSATPTARSFSAVVS